MTILSDPVELTASAEGEGEATGEAEEVCEEELAAEAIEVAEFEVGTSPFAMSIRQYPPAPSSSQIDCLSGVKRYNES